MRTLGFWDGIERAPPLFAMIQDGVLRRDSLRLVEETVARLREAAMTGEVRLMEQLRAELVACAREAGVDVRAPVRDLEATGYRRGLMRALAEAEGAIERGQHERARLLLNVARQCAFHTGEAVDGRIAAIAARSR